MKKDKEIKSVYDIFCETLGWEIFSDPEKKVDIQKLEFYPVYDAEENLHPGIRFDATVKETDGKTNVYKGIEIALGMNSDEDQLNRHCNAPQDFARNAESVLDAFGLSREKVFDAFQFKALEQVPEFVMQALVLDAAGHTRVDDQTPEDQEKIDEVKRDLAALGERPEIGWVFRSGYDHYYGHTFAIAPSAKHPKDRPSVKELQSKKLSMFQEDVLRTYLTQDAPLVNLAKDITKSMKQENLASMRANAKTYVKDFFIEEERKKSAHKAMETIEACLKTRIHDPKLLNECLKDIEASLLKQAKDGKFVGVNVLDINAPSQNPRIIAAPNQNKERTR